MRRVLVKTVFAVAAVVGLGGQPAQAQLTKKLAEAEKKQAPPARLLTDPKPLPPWASAAPYTWSIPSAAKPALDRTKFPEERLRVVLLSGYPNLGTEFEVVAPRTGHVDHPKSQVPGVKQYNCIAWSLGITDRWVWPGKTVREFDALYARYGYKRAETRNLKLEAGVAKVALYGKLTDAGELSATHAARQEADGTWTSKLGGEARIRHLTADAVAGPVYGDPIAVYVKKR
jgi:hypothetical protein